MPIVPCVQALLYAPSVKLIITFSKTQPCVQAQPVQLDSMLIKTDFAS